MLRCVFYVLCVIYILKIVMIPEELCLCLFEAAFSFESSFCWVKSCEDIHKWPTVTVCAQNNETWLNKADRRLDTRNQGTISNNIHVNNVIIGLFQESTGLKCVSHVFIRHVGDSLYTLKLTSRALLLVLTQVLETKILSWKSFVCEFEVVEPANWLDALQLVSSQFDRHFRHSCVSKSTKNISKQIKHFRLTYYTAISSWSFCVPRMPYRFLRWYNKVENAHPDMRYGQS